MSNDKSPGNDDHTKEFYETSWEEIKIALCIVQRNQIKTKN